MWYYGIIQSEHCNNDNNYIDDIMMRASVCFEFFGGISPISKPTIYGREMWQQGGRFKLRTYVPHGVGI